MSFAVDEQIAANLADADSFQIGYTVIDQAVSEGSGTFEEIGQQLSSTIRRAISGEITSIAAVEMTLIAITGAGFEATLNEVKAEWGDGQ